MNRLVANQDLRLAGRVYHLDYPGIHVRFGGQSVGCKATETLTVPILVGKSSAMNADRPGRSILGSQPQKTPAGRRSQIPPWIKLHHGRRPRSHTSTASLGFSPPNPHRQLSWPSDSEGGRLFTTRTRARSGWATETQILVPGGCLDQFPGLRGARMLGEEFALGALPLGALSRPPRRVELGEFPRRQPNVTCRRISDCTTTRGRTRW